MENPGYLRVGLDWLSGHRLETVANSHCTASAPFLLPITISTDIVCSSTRILLPLESFFRALSPAWLSRCSSQHLRAA